MVPFWVYEHTDDNDEKEISTTLANVAYPTSICMTQEHLYHWQKNSCFDTFHKATFPLICSQTGLN